MLHGFTNFQNQFYFSLPIYWIFFFFYMCMDVQREICFWWWFVDGNDMGNIEKK